jgi:hypothetical protein
MSSLRTHIVGQVDPNHIYALPGNADSAVRGPLLNERDAPVPASDNRLADDETTKSPLPKNRRRHLRVVAVEVSS